MHDLDMARFLMGCEPVKVLAMGSCQVRLAPALALALAPALALARARARARALKP